MMIFVVKPLAVEGSKFQVLKHDALQFEMHDPLTHTAQVGRLLAYWRQQACLLYSS
jgi:hypothetical protein